MDGKRVEFRRASAKPERRLALKAGQRRESERERERERRRGGGTGENERTGREYVRAFDVRPDLRR